MLAFILCTIFLVLYSNPVILFLFFFIPKHFQVQADIPVFQSLYTGLPVPCTVHTTVSIYPYICTMIDFAGFSLHSDQHSDNLIASCILYIYKPSW